MYHIGPEKFVRLITGLVESWVRELVVGKSYVELYHLFFRGYSEKLRAGGRGAHQEILSFPAMNHSGASLKKYPDAAKECNTTLLKFLNNIFSGPDGKSNQVDPSYDFGENESENSWPLGQRPGTAGSRPGTAFSEVLGVGSWTTGAGASDRCTVVSSIRICTFNLTICTCDTDNLYLHTRRDFAILALWRFSPCHHAIRAIRAISASSAISAICAICAIMLSVSSCNQCNQCTQCNQCNQ